MRFVKQPDTFKGDMGRDKEENPRDLYMIAQPRTWEGGFAITFTVWQKYDHLGIKNPTQIDQKWFYSSRLGEGGIAVMVNALGAGEVIGETAQAMLNDIEFYLFWQGGASDMDNLMQIHFPEHHKRVADSLEST